MLTINLIAFESYEDFNDFINDLASFQFHHLIHTEEVDETRYFIVALHNNVYNHFKVQEFLKSYNFKLLSHSLYLFHQ